MAISIKLLKGQPQEFQQDFYFLNHLSLFYLPVYTQAYDCSIIITAAIILNVLNSAGILSEVYK